MLMELAGTCAQGGCNGHLVKTRRGNAKYYLCSLCLTRYERSFPATLRRCRLSVAVAVLLALFMLADLAIHAVHFLSL